MSRRIVSLGLAPSGTLAPSATLAPMDTIYAGGPITPHQIWLATGTGGTFVNTSPYVEFGEGVSYTYGRQTMFEDVSPGTFTFTLNNADGRFTPDNPASPLPVKVTEGMIVMWVLGTRLVRGEILSVEIPADEATWDHLVVTCDDMLGVAGRHSFSTVVDGLLARSGPKVLWKLDEDSEQQYGAESFGDPLGPFSLYRSNPSSMTEAVTFGAEQAPGLPGTAVTVTAAAGETNWFGTRHGNTVRNTNIATPTLGTGTAGQSVIVGFWNFWVYPGSTINFAYVPVFGVENPGYAWSAQIRCTPTSYTVKPGTSAGYTYNLSATEQLAPHHLSMRLSMVWQTSGNYWALYTALYVDGTFTGQAPWYDPQHGFHVPAYLNSLSPVEVSVSATGGASQVSGTVQRISYTTVASLNGIEHLALIPTLDGRRIVADYIGEDVNTAVYNGPLSSAPTGFPDEADATILDLLNEIARTEAGHLFTQTLGVPGGSVTYIEVRARDRPATPKTVFDVAADLSGPPSFVRDITNVAASVDVAGPTQTVTVTDPTITGRYVTNGAGETVLYAGVDDLRGWGQDRLYRGKNRAVRAQSFTVDAVTTKVDRSAALLALVPGDRIQLTGTPAGRLGFSTWDGWVLGASESHTPNSNSFTFNLTPALPTPAAYGTAEYAAGGDILVGSALTTSSTTFVYQTYGPPMSTTFPYTIQIDNEQMTVTALTGSTLTVTRGVNGTTAASHTVNTAVEIIPTALYAY